LISKNDISAGLLFLILPVLYVHPVTAQSGDSRSFTFVDVPQSPRVTGLGGVNITLSDGDGNMLISNPALMVENSTGQVSFNHYFYYSGISFNSFTYIHDFGKTGNWGIGLQQAAYGKFDSYDASGNPLGQTQAGEYAVVIGNAHKAGNFILGADLKFVFSNIASYRATVLLGDIGGIFKHPSQDLTIGLLIHNPGFVISDFTTSSSSSIPFDVRTGITYKPMHMPFRFSMTIQNLTSGNLPYYDDHGSTLNEAPGNFDKIFSHIVLGMELVINKNLIINGGYNHLIRQELRLQEVSGGAGFSYGILVRVKAFSFSYAGAFYHVAGNTNHLGLSVNLSSLYNRKKLN
jgi:hypothetical protein